MFYHWHCNYHCLHIQHKLQQMIQLHIHHKLQQLIIKLFVAICNEYAIGLIVAICDEYANNDNCNANDKTHCALSFAS